MTKADRIRRLLEHGWDVAFIASEIGCSSAYVRTVRLRTEIPGYGENFASRKRALKTRRIRYNSDPAYRAHIRASVKRSNEKSRRARHAHI